MQPEYLMHGFEFTFTLIFVFAFACLRGSAIYSAFILSEFCVDHPKKITKGNLTFCLPSWARLSNSIL